MEGKWVGTTHLPTMGVAMLQLRGKVIVTPYIRVVTQADDYKQSLSDRARYAAPYTHTAGRRDETPGCES